MDIRRRCRTHRRRVAEPRQSASTGGGAAQEQNNFIKTHEVRLCQINEAGNLALVWCDYEIIHQTGDGPCVTYSGCSTLNFSMTETGLLIIADTGMIHGQSS